MCHRSEVGLVAGTVGRVHEGQPVDEDVLKAQASGEDVGDEEDLANPVDAPAEFLDELTERPGQTLFEVCSRLSMKHQLSMSRQAVSQHLAVLEAAGLIESRREGRYEFHDLNTAPLKRIAERWIRPDA